MATQAGASGSRWRALGALLRPDVWRWVGLGVLVAIGSALTIAGPLVVRRVVDTAADGTTAAEITRLALVFLVIAACAQLIAVIVAWLATVAAWRTTNGLRLTMTRHVLGLDHEFHRTHTPGELIQRADGDITSVSDFLSQVVTKAAGAAMLVSGMVIVLGVIDWRLGLGMAVYVGLALVVIVRTRHRAVSESSDEMGALGRLYGGIEERLTAAEDLRANGAADHVAWRFVEDSEGALVSAVRRERAFLVMWWFVQGAVAAGWVLSLVLGAALVAAGTITIGTAFLLFQFVLLVARPLEEVVHELETVQKANGAMVRVADLLAIRPNVLDDGDTSPPPGPLSITSTDVDFDYGDDRPVLAAVDLHIGAGRSVGIVGRTGSGKTTFSRLVLRLVEPTGGQVSLGGVPIADIPLVELRRRVALVPQEVELFAGTLRDNVTLFDDEPTDAAVVDALQRVGLGMLAAGGIDRELGAAGAGLSAGEAQLLALARVWLRNPDIVVLDEATARVDPDTERRLEAAVVELMRGRTTLVIAHRLSTLRSVDEIIVFDHGRVVEHGDRTDLVGDDDSRFARLLALALDNEAADGTDPTGSTLTQSDTLGSDAMTAGVELAQEPEIGPRPPTDAGHVHHDPTLDDELTLDGVPNVWALAWRVSQHRPKEFWLGWFLFVVFFMMPAVSGYLLGQGYDALERGDTTETMWWAAAIAVSETIRMVAIHHGALIWTKAWIHMQTLLRANMLAAQMASGGVHAGQPIGSAGSAITHFRDDTEDVANLVDGMVDISGGIVFTVIAGFVLGAADARATAVLVIPLLGVGIATRVLDTRIKEYRAADRQATEGVTGLLGDVMAAATTVKVNDATEPMLRRLAVLVERRRYTAVRDRVLEEGVQAFSQGAADIGLGLVLLVSAGAIASGSFDLGTLALFTAYLGWLSFLPRMVGRVLARRKQAGVAFDRMRALVADQEAENTVRRQRLPIDPSDQRLRPDVVRPDRVALERLEVDGLTVSYGGRPVVDDVSFGVARGEFVVITGPVGAGKSTLLRALLGLAWQAEVHGSVRWNGAEIDDRAAFLVPPNAAFLSQVPQLISDSVADNVGLGPVTDADLARAFELSAIATDIAEMPEGAATLIGPRGLRLSGGQRQRLATARALVHAPELVVLDDLSSALDVETEVQLWTNLADAGMTVIAVSHRAVAFDRADQVLRFDAGRLAE